MKKIRKCGRSAPKRASFRFGVILVRTLGVDGDEERYCETGMCINIKPTNNGTNVC